MQQTWDKAEQAKQREILASLYADYDAKRHDAFVHRYNQDAEDAALVQYWKNRGIEIRKPIHHT